MIQKSLTRLYLIRHGEVVGHHEYRYNGHTNVDITEEGMRQMERLSEFFSSLDPTRNKNVSAIYSSDLIRSFKGAKVIGKALKIEPKKIEALRELHLGRWEGLTRAEAGERYPEEADFSFKHLALNMKVKGGESIEELRRRVVPAIDDIIERHEGSAVCVVAHGGVNRVLLCDAMGLGHSSIFNIEQDYGCLNVIDYLEDGMRVVKLLNGGPNQHLKPTVLY